MPNQRVVVLTDEQVWECIEAIEVNYEVNGDSHRRQEVIENYPAGKLLTKLRAALEHPEGITGEMKRRGAEPRDKRKKPVSMARVDEEITCTGEGSR